MREYEIKPHLQRILKKLYKKNRFSYEAVMKKITEIMESENPDHYKNLRHNMKDKKRVHIAKSYVLIFHYDKTKNHISFQDYDHHDKIYKK